MFYKRITVNNNLKEKIISMKDSWRICLLLTLFITGLIIGSFVIKNNNSLLINQIEQIVKNSVTEKSSSSFIKNFFDFLLPNTVYLILSFTFGFCAVGIPLISLLPLIKGFGMGIIGAYIYQAFAIKGVCYCLLIFFPAQIISSAVLIYACNEGFYMASELFNALRIKQISKEKDFIRVYLTRFVILLSFLLIASFTDSLLSSIFSGFFVLF